MIFPRQCGVNAVFTFRDFSTRRFPYVRIRNPEEYTRCKPIYRARSVSTRNEFPNKIGPRKKDVDPGGIRRNFRGRARVMEQRVTRIGAAGAKRGNKAIKYEAVGKTRDPAALFTGWCRRAAASVKITREFHCSRLSFFLLSPAPFLLFFSFFFSFFSPPRAHSDIAKEKGFFAVAFPPTTPTRTFLYSSGTLGQKEKPSSNFSSRCIRSAGVSLAPPRLLQRH